MLDVAGDEAAIRALFEAYMGGFKRFDRASSPAF